VGQSPQRGPADALVTLVVFSDFQCPYCKKVEPTLTALRVRYGDRLRIVWKDEPLPFHPRAVPAAMLAREARAQKGDSGFWAMHDELFERQPQLDDADLEAAAVKVGLNAKNAMAAIAAKKHKAGIDKDMDLADDVQASGTPHFFVNGKRLVGAQPLEKFVSTIDEELKTAQDLVSKGTPKAKVYDTIMATAERPEPPAWIAPPDVDAKMPFRGAAGAKLVIQEFSDFQCPFCSRVEPTMTEILKDYGTRVKIVWRNNPLPLHADAPLAAQAALEAHAQKGNDGFFKMHGLLFGDQQNLKRERLEEHARTLGLDMARFTKALDTGVHKAAITKDQDAAKNANAMGTPAFFIGPYLVSGAQPYSKFKKVIEYAFANPVPPIKVGVVQRPAAPGAAAVVAAPNANPNAVAKNGDKLVVLYVGKLTDGTVFDSSVARGTPFEFEIGKGHVIRGWEKGLIGMKAGERKTLRIPPEDGYGLRGAPPTIPPNATLVFEVELLAVR
jgi:protein-disulfide isomerase